jgi:hypothetical protein
MTQEDFEPASCPEDEVSSPVLPCNKSTKKIFQNENDGYVVFKNTSTGRLGN